MVGEDGEGVIAASYKSCLEPAVHPVGSDDFGKDIVVYVVKSREVAGPQDTGGAAAQGE